MDKKLNGITFLELCYVSPDWRISRNEKLQEILVNMVADVLEIPNEKRKDTFHWHTDEASQHKHLLVQMHYVPEKNRSYKHLKFVLDYSMGLANGMGFC